MRLVIIESPYAGKTPIERERNIAYARAAMADCLKRGEAPYASHLLFTQPGILDDDKLEERAQGIEAGLRWGEFAHATVVYLDRGISSGMQHGIDRAITERRPVEHRVLGSQWATGNDPKPIAADLCFTHPSPFVSTAVGFVTTRDQPGL